ncbi:MAG: serine/threonine-protein phosphatase [Planctomycetaceae bacterium]|nr:serine/threonine-protein phosphatase [Planctomycetaceae bacterium]
MTGLTAEVFCKPYGGDKNGGDVYYLTSCASGRISRVLLADVTGHGQQVAETADKLRSIMRQNVNVIRQSNLMAGINREFNAISEDGGFATAVVATYFSPRQSLTVSIAGHPRPLLYQAKSRQWTAFGISDNAGSNLDPALPFGILEETTYQTLQVAFTPGDMLLCHTDAFSEALDKSGNLLNSEGLIGILNDLDEPENAIRWLHSQLEKYHADNLKNDDVTALLIRPTGNRISFKDNIKAAIRLVGRVTEIDSGDQRENLS